MRNLVSVVLWSKKHWFYKNASVTLMCNVVAFKLKCKLKQFSLTKSPVMWKCDKILYKLWISDIGFRSIMISKIRREFGQNAGKKIKIPSQRKM